MKSKKETLDPKIVSRIKEARDKRRLTQLEKVTDSNTRVARIKNRLVQRASLN